MSELFMELFFNVIAGLLEMVGEVLLGDFASSDTMASRIFWCIILAVLGGIIWWEVR
jgi:hypothetical protein